MTQTVKQISLELDFGAARQEALRYARRNGEATLGDLLRLHPARARQPLPPDYLDEPLSRFLLTPITLDGGSPINAGSTASGAPAGSLRGVLDDLHTEDVQHSREPAVYPAQLSDNEAVQRAYRLELEQIAKYLAHELSVLVVCDKMLTAHLYEYVCTRAGKIPVLDTDAPPGQAPGGSRAAFEQALQGPQSGLEQTLPLLLRSLKSNQVLVLRSVDRLDNPALLELLYAGGGDHKPQLLGFLDPSLEVKKVLTDRFAIRVGLMGLPRYVQPDPDKPPVHTVTQLITQPERDCFAALDAENLYKNVAGLNALQFRDAMRYVGATVVPGTEARKVYDLIRQFKTTTTSDIEVPDTNFDNIGGYDAVKQELKRIIALVSGQVQGMDARERARLTPRGFIFHGPPGTGKTLFAKAIANEMNATIQMVSGPEIMDKYVGQSESNLRQIFATARRNAPSVIFFDEFDSLASQRSTYSDGGSRANNAVVAQLLTELDGFREEQAVLLIGTTNRLDIIDEALLRPSRLRPIEIPLPDFDARRAVARIHAEGFGVAALLKQLYQLSHDFLGAWQADPQNLPPAFLAALFEQHTLVGERYERTQQRYGLAQDLRQVFQTVQQATAPSSEAAPDPALKQVAEKLHAIAERHHLDLTAASPPEHSLQADLHSLFALVQPVQRSASAADAFVESVLDLVAEYTEGFNNDEIRAIFQEASLEYHMAGQLVTPRYLGMKIGFIRKRRDERQMVHLAPRR